MSESKWHMSPTQAGKIGGRLHYDIGADDNENIALVYPAEDGDAVTAERAKLICEAPETKRQRDMLLAAAKRAQTLFRAPPDGALGADYVNGVHAEVRAAIASCTGDGE